MYIFTQPFTSL